MPVPGPLALIRQNRQQTPVVESSLNKYIASWPSPTPWPKTRLLQIVPNSQEGVVFIYLRFVYKINSHSVRAILAYILHIFGFIILPIENMVSFGIRHLLQNCTTLQLVTLVFISTPFLSWTLLTFYSVLLYFAGIIVQVMEQVSVLLIFIIIFSIYIKGTTTQDFYQSVFSNVSMPVAM